MELTDAMEDHIKRHVDKLPHYYDRLTSLHVTLALDSGSHMTELLAHSHKTTFVAEFASHDLYESIDLAFQKLERQLVRHHDKLRSRRAGGASPAEGTAGAET